MLKEVETDKTIVFLAIFLSLVTFELGGTIDVLLAADQNAE